MTIEKEIEEHIKLCQERGHRFMCFDDLVPYLKLLLSLHKRIEAQEKELDTLREDAIGSRTMILELRGRIEALEKELKIVSKSASDSAWREIRRNNGGY